MRVIGTFLIVVAALGRPSPADCQRLATPLVSFNPSNVLVVPRAPSNMLLAPGAVRWPSVVMDTEPRRAVPRTYWLEGGLIGAGALGLVTAVFGVLIHSPASEVLWVSGVGAAIGFVPGMFIGGQIPKKGGQPVSSP